MTAAQWLALLAILDTHQPPPPRTLVAAAEAEWQQARTREPKPAEEES